MPGLSARRGTIASQRFGYASQRYVSLLSEVFSNAADVVLAAAALLAVLDSAALCQWQKVVFVHI
ncbi:MAG: hypothetical protein ACSHWQ_00010 [Spongiibacteraceae bacterium]